MKSLPNEILYFLCIFYDLFERTGVWPYAVTHAAVSFIRKNEGGEPLSLRPLSVLPVSYRIWVAIRF